MRKQLIIKLLPKLLPVISVVTFVCVAAGGNGWSWWWGYKLKAPKL
jgi:hypothetical protein